MLTNDAEVHPRRFRGLQNILRPFVAEGNADCVEERLRPDLVSEPSESLGEDFRMEVNAVRDLLEASGAVVARIHRRQAGQQRLRGADVARGFLAADMLFARLEGEPQ